MVYVFTYLMCAAISSIAVRYFGDQYAIPASFFLTGFILTSRDFLHDRWRYRMFFPKMISLIMFGSALSMITSILYYRDDPEIVMIESVAMSAAFLFSGFIDMASYDGMMESPRFIRVNYSNFFSAAADSIIFTSIAHTSWIDNPESLMKVFLPYFIIQFVTKVSGGFLWYIVLTVISGIGNLLRSLRGSNQRTA